jgi:hypothetical protein
MAEKPRELNVVEKLREILDSHNHERVCVVGTTCTGKSYLISHISQAQDMDELIFPKLSAEESKYVMSKPWTEDIGRTMNRLVRERIKIGPGRPVFGTVVIPSDYIIYLKISDTLLRERTQKRGKQYQDAKNMQAQLEEEIKRSRIPYEELEVK